MTAQSPFLEARLELAGESGKQTNYTARPELESPFVTALARGIDLGSEPRHEQFGSPEHRSFGDGSAQAMVDEWAREGLIAGGAFIDKGPGGRRAKPLQKWKIGIGSNSPLSPDAHWHWIAPNAHTDVTGHPWTAASLKGAISEGRALCLTIGEILMMAGDLAGSFEELQLGGAGTVREGDAIDGDLMKGYDDRDPLAWTLLRVKLLSELDTDYDRFDLGLFLSDDVERDLAARRLLITVKDSYPDVHTHIVKLSHGWAKVKKVVGSLRALRNGTHGYLHVLAQLMAQDLPIDASALRAACPWMSAALSSTLAESKTSFDEDMVQTILSNSRYFHLAMKNAAHFSPSNWSTFESHHSAALDLIRESAALAKPTAIPADAIARTAFGLHFLTDAFASGHIRTPREKLGTHGLIAAKLMHDVDNKVGLYVKNGFGHRWLAVGDSQLKGDRKAVLPPRFPTDTLEFHRTRINTAVVDAIGQLAVHAVNAHKANPNGHSLLRRYAPAKLARFNGTPGPATSWREWTTSAMKTYMRWHRPVAESWSAQGGWKMAMNGKASHPPLILDDLSPNTRHYEVTGTKSAWITAKGIGRDLHKFSEQYLLIYLEPTHPLSKVLMKWAPTQGLTRKIVSSLEDGNPLRKHILKEVDESTGDQAPYPGAEGEEARRSADDDGAWETEDAVPQGPFPVDDLVPEVEG